MWRTGCSAHITGYPIGPDGEFEIIKTATLNPFAVKITDVDKAKHFYENVIGLHKIPRPKIDIPGEWYGIGENALHLIGGKARDGIDPTGPHMAIQVEDFEATKRGSRSWGCLISMARRLLARWLRRHKRWSTGSFGFWIPMVT
jgi:predicted enzyme related to lactoylglutathione lyase